MNPRRLYRSRYDRQLAGVAGGMAEYLEVDPTVVRLLWIVSAFFGGFTILLYIILAFVMPLAPEPWPAPGPWQPTGGPGSPDAEGAEGGEGAEGTGQTSDAGVGPAAAGPGPGVAGAPVAGAIPGWRGPDGAAWAYPPPRPPRDRRPGRGGLYLGVGLIVFGAIAALDLVVPGLAGNGLLWAGLVVALGVALVAGSTRRASAAR